MFIVIVLVLIASSNLCCQKVLLPQSLSIVIKECPKALGKGKQYFCFESSVEEEIDKQSQWKINIGNSENRSYIKIRPHNGVNLTITSYLPYKDEKALIGWRLSKEYYSEAGTLYTLALQRQGHFLIQCPQYIKDQLFNEVQELAFGDEVYSDPERMEREYNVSPEFSQLRL